MPIIHPSTYQAPLLLFNGHMETIFPAIFRKSPLLLPKRDRITTQDKDFLDVDVYDAQSRSLVIICHGLEGNSKRPYVTHMARAFISIGFNVVAWNYRGCSEEMNRKQFFYHSGATYDLDEIIEHYEKLYDQIILTGFSLGGNLTLKYLGEKENLNPKIKAASVYSVPLHLHSSSICLNSFENRIYNNRFLRSLKAKLVHKASLMPVEYSIKHLDKIKTLLEFDDEFTAPLHGFQNGIDYYEKCSSAYFIDNINVPTLIINAVNDPFLSDECYPKEQCKLLEHVYLETPGRGGHTGFTSFRNQSFYWSEIRAMKFVNEVLKD